MGNKRYLGLVCVGLIAIVAIAASMSGGDKASSDTGNSGGTDSSNTAKALLTPGTYKVGEDIKPGEYYAVSTGSNMYIAVSKDSTGELTSINYNLNTNGNVYITLKEGEYIEINGGEVYDLEGAPYTKPENGVLPEGMYKVGKDIAPGEYKLNAVTSNGYIEVTTNSRHDLSGTITNDNFKTNKIITVSKGQYLLVMNAELKITDDQFLRK